MKQILAVLPLALTMNLGPQIVTAVIAVTGRKPVKKSLAYLAAILLAVTIITFAAFLIFQQVGGSTSTSGQSQTSRILDYIFAGLLAILAIRVFLKRKEATKKPKWMSSIQDSEPGGVFKIGLMLYSFMPTDLISMLTVGQYLASHELNFASCIPFIGLTLFIAALPLLFYLLFRKRAEAVMPRIQGWMDANAWLINEIVIVFFICMILFT